MSEGDCFQWIGQLGKADEMPLQPQIVLELFEKWAINFVVPFNPPSHQKAYILVMSPKNVQLFGLIQPPNLA